MFHFREAEKEKGFVGKKDKEEGRSEEKEKVKDLLCLSSVCFSRVDITQDQSRCLAFLEPFLAAQKYS